MSLLRILADERCNFFSFGLKLKDNGSLQGKKMILKHEQNQGCLKWPRIDIEIPFFWIGNTVDARTEREEIDPSYPRANFNASEIISLGRSS